MSQKKKGHAPAHQNKYTWAHNPHSKLTKKIAALEHYNLCYRCDQQIEWRKQYRKYKPLSAMRRCSVCSNHAITRAYHTICDDCAQHRQVCAKCAKPYDITAKSKPIPDEEVLEAIRLSQIKERFKRTIMRNWERGLFVNSDILKILDLLNNGKEVIWEDWLQQDEEEEGEEEEHDETTTTTAAAAKKPHVHGSACGSGGCGSGSAAGPTGFSGPNTSAMGKLEHAEKMRKAEALRKLDLSELLPEDFIAAGVAPNENAKKDDKTTTGEKKVVEENKEMKDATTTTTTIATEPVVKEKKKIIVKPKATMNRTAAMLSLAKGGKQ